MLCRIFHPRLARPAVALACLSLFSSTSFAAPGSQAAGKAASVPSYSAALQPGDVLSVTVQKHPEWSVTAATVGADGRIHVPAAGAVDVRGKSIDQIDAAIEKALRKRLLQPEVTVSIAQLQPRRVTMQGVVEKPSNYEIGPGWRVSDAIAAAGGLHLRADLTSATLTRAGQPAITLNLPKILENDPVANIELRPNDRLNFVGRTVTVQVAGKVNTPGPVTVPIGQGVVEALSLAGGASPNAALSQTTIQRGKTTIPIDLYAAITLHQKDVDRPVQDGDLILVPEVTGRVTVSGAVNKPGYLDVPDGRKLNISEAIAQVGGATTGAALTRTVVTHADGKSVIVDLYRVTISNDPAANIVLQPSDIVTVPQARGVTVLGAAVNTPGTYFVEEGAQPRVSDALAKAGGLKGAPDSTKISVSRVLPDGKQLSLDVDPVLLIDKGDASQNARIYDGDFVYVSSTLRTVYINGVNQDGQSTVKSPGVYEVKAGDGVRELLARAGGVGDNAALSRVQVQRAGKVEVVNALASANGGAGSHFELLPGDNVLVPALEAKVNVMPAVNKPGLVYLPEDKTLTVGDVLALAGGPAQGAKVKEIALYRIGPNKTLEQRMISLDPAVKKKDYADISLPVQNGDYIYVPQDKAKTSGFQQLSQMLGPLAILGRLF